MKKALAVALGLAGGPFGYQLAQAQMVVNDPVYMGVHIGQFAKQVGQWAQTVNNYQVVKDARQIGGVTRDITGQVKDLTQQGLELQHQFRPTYARWNRCATCATPTPSNYLAGPWR